MERADVMVKEAVLSGRQKKKQQFLYLFKTFYFCFFSYQLSSITCSNMCQTTITKKTKQKKKKTKKNKNKKKQ